MSKSTASNIRFMTDQRTYVDVFVDGTKIRLTQENSTEKTFEKALKAAKEKDTKTLEKLADIPNLHGWSVKQNNKWVNGEIEIVAPRAVTHNAEVFSLMLNKLVSNKCPEVLFNFLHTSAASSLMLNEAGQILFLVSRSPRAEVLNVNEVVSSASPVSAINTDAMLPVSSYVDSKRNYLVCVEPSDLVAFNGQIFATSYKVVMEVNDEMADDHYVTVLQGF